MELSIEAKDRLTIDQHDFTEMLESLKGEMIYKSGFTIFIYEKIFNIIYHNEIKCEYLSELILCNEASLVGKMTADYVLKGYVDASNVMEFVTNKVAELHPV